MVVPAQKPFRSRQDYATPSNIIEAVKRRLLIDEFLFDFAADADNAKAAMFWGEAEDSLSKSADEWAVRCRSGHGFGWLNPPFARIGPWARRCMETKRLGGSVVLLVPAAIGANWYRDYVDGHASVLALNGRIAFMPDRPQWLYPKDCILCLYSPSIAPGFAVWTWRDARRPAA